MTREGSRAGKLRLDAREFAWTVGIMGLTTLAAFVVRPARGEVSGALIFVLGIMIAGSVSGLGAALLAAMASFLLYNFYFAEPVLTFRFDTISDFTPLIVFNICALIAGLLAGRLKNEAQVAAKANASLATLLQVSRSLQSALTLEDIRAALEDPAAVAIGIRLIPAEDGEEPGDGSPGLLPAAAGTPTIAYRLEGAHGEPVVVREAAHPTEAAFGSALANLVALAIERAFLSEKIVEAEAAIRVEALKTALLSSISHDFRTPLATISASASSLIDYGDRLDQPVSAGLLRGIVEESERLNRFTANLLEMTKLEAGQPAPGQTLAVADLIAAALRRVRPKAGQREFERLDQSGDIIVLAEPSLFELALVNVLENAILYSDDPSRIRVALRKAADMCEITISDEGRGIPPAELDRVFDRFYRVDSSEQMPRGSGLGLAIAKGFVQAFGGSIEARIPGIGDRGTAIRILLPLANPESTA